MKSITYEEGLKGSVQELSGRDPLGVTPDFPRTVQTGCYAKWLRNSRSLRYSVRARLAKTKTAPPV